MKVNLIKEFVSFQITFLVLITLILIVTIACDNSTPAQFDVNVIFPTDANPSFNKHVRPFITQKCSYTGCHSEFSAAGGRRITDYFTYFETANIGLIINGNSKSSLLFQVVSGSNPHLSNYRIKAPTQNQIDGIKRWIDNGAPNN